MIWLLSQRKCWVFDFLLEADKLSSSWIIPIMNVYPRWMILEAVSPNLGGSEAKKPFSVGTYRKLLRTWKRKSDGHIRLPALLNSRQLRTESENFSHRIFHWISASNFLAFSDVFLLDSVQTSRLWTY